jgi:hypothetical protein
MSPINHGRSGTGILSPLRHGAPGPCDPAGHPLQNGSPDGLWYGTVITSMFLPAISFLKNRISINLRLQVEV